MRCRIGRGRVIATLALGIFAAPLAADAQRPAVVPRIGILAVSRSPRVGAFWEGMRELGYVEGRNIVVERRFAGGKLDRLSGLAAELVRLQVDVIVAPDPPSTRAAVDATQTIPIVIRSSSDPVEAGLVSSLAGPGANVTGVYSIADELIGKRLEPLKEPVLHVSRVAILWSREEPGAARSMVDENPQ